jgi:hypothetical protein
MSASAFAHSAPPTRGNMPAAISDQERRVLVLAPTGHDARLSAEFLTKADILVGSAGYRVSIRSGQDSRNAGIVVGYPDRHHHGWRG